MDKNKAEKIEKTEKNEKTDFKTASKAAISSVKKSAADVKAELSESLRPVYAALLCLAAMLCIVAFLGMGKDTFVAGTAPSVDALLVEKRALDSDSASYSLTEADSYQIIRGSSVKRLKEKLKIGDVTYVKIKDRSAPLKYAASMLKRGSGIIDSIPEYQYIREDSLTDDANDIVRETEVFVRTPVTIYAQQDGPAIASFAQKGSCLNVSGYDKIKTDGSVNKYKVEYTNDEGEPAEGYVYARYLSDTREKADAVYDGNGIQAKVKKDNYGMKLYGGKAAHLDYYPYDKPVIEGNEFLSDAKTMYLNCAAGTHPEEYIKLINETGCNAVVVDIKDGVLAYKSEVAREMSPRSYKTAYASVDDYRAGIDALRNSGVYLIGRIVVFNDPIYAKDHPEECIIWGKNTGWPSAYSRTVWEYNVRLACEAVREFGFNEIQMDYVRFPENSYEMSKSGSAEFRNKYNEEKGQAVQNFCFYAADQIHEAGAYFSVDVFGESVYGYMTAYGQYWPGISNIVDAISAMPYTDHMGADGAWENPYGTVKAWAKRAAKRQKYLENPASARTWITGYDTPNWAPTVIYGKKQLKAQVKALNEQGLDGGFIPWNSGSSLGKYRSYKEVWNE